MSETTPREMLDDIHSALQADILELNDWESGFVDGAYNHGLLQNRKAVSVIKRMWHKTLTNR